MKNVFFIVGPTATGKSEIAADVACTIDAEIVSGDAFQVYQGFDLLTAKPDVSTLAKVPHHLIGAVPPAEEMNAQKFRDAAVGAIDGIHSRGKLALVVGGSGLYIKALTHGLAATAAADRNLRAELRDLSLGDLCVKLSELDPETARKIDMKNRRRVMRAIEICMLTGKPVSAQRTEWKVVKTDLEDGAPATPFAAGSQELAPPGGLTPKGIFVFRDRDELRERINDRVQAMFENGVVDEVSTNTAMSSTAAKMIGLHEIRDFIAGRTPEAQCVAQIQQATRRYAKRQLTWFRHQTNFEPLNLSLLTHDEAVKWISQRVVSFAQG